MKTHEELNYTFHRLIDNIELEYPILLTKNQVLKYLYFLDRTNMNSASTIDVIDYEKLIYIELNFKDDEEIQTLLNNIKLNIKNRYEDKQRYIKRLTDNLIPEFLSENFNNTHGMHTNALVLNLEDVYANK